VINMLAERWRDPEYGVRPLKRAIQRHIVDELALYLLENHIEEWSVLSLTIHDDKVMIS
jgi:ATP-dependent Clp protease ATP-binding subunit ClpB